jgi:uncharacterized membrane protein YdjX (TVP38/TMEM64 family)
VAALIRFGPILLVAAGLITALSLGLQRYLSFEFLAAQRGTLLALVEAQPWLVAGAFAGIYILATATSLPGAIWLTIGGGFLFGPVLGTALSAGSATIGATILFLAAQSALGDGLRAKAGSFAGRFEAGFRENAFWNLLTLRLLPVAPFWGVNLAAAALRVPLGTFVGSTAIGILPGGFVYALLGNGLGAAISAGEAPNLSLLSRPEILAPLFGLAFLALLPTLTKALKGRKAAPTPETPA